MNRPIRSMSLFLILAGCNFEKGCRLISIVSYTILFVNLIRENCILYLSTVSIPVNSKDMPLVYGTTFIYVSVRFLRVIWFLIRMEKIRIFFASLISNINFPNIKELRKDSLILNSFFISSTLILSVRGYIL